jgi:hypothetical protein
LSLDPDMMIALTFSISKGLLPIFQSYNGRIPTLSGHLIKFSKTTFCIRALAGKAWNILPYASSTIFKTCVSTHITTNNQNRSIS